MRLLLFCFLASVFIKPSFSQINAQLGYDIGVYNPSFVSDELLNESNTSHILHRPNIKLDYKLRNNIFFGFKTGLDFHDYKHNIVYVSQGNTYAEIRETSILKANMNSYHLGISVGYEYCFNFVSSLFFRINYDQFFVNRVTNKESSFKKEYFSISETGGKQFVLGSEEHRTMIDFSEIGYYQKLNFDNRHIMISLGYRYYINPLFFSFSISYSPINRSLFNTGFTSPKGNQNIFLLGLSLGYTFP